MAWDTDPLTENMEAHVRLIVRQELRTVFAAALADPGVDHRAKSLAGYALKYLSRNPQYVEQDLAPLIPETTE